MPKATEPGYPHQEIGNAGPRRVGVFHKQHMQRITEIWKYWDKKEQKLFREWLALFRKQSADDKQLQLLRLIDKNPQLDAADASEKLYGKPGSKAFLMLKKRLFDRMTDFMCGGHFQADREVPEDMPYQANLLLYRKYVYLGTILVERRHGKLAWEFFQRAQEMAQSCQTPELEVDCLLRLRGLYIYSERSFEELTEELNSALERTRIDTQALALYHRFFQGPSMRTSTSQELPAFLGEGLDELLPQLEEHFAVRAAYYLNLLAGARAYFLRDFDLAMESGRRSMDLLERYPGLRSRQRWADVCTHMGQYALMGQTYAKGITLFLKGRRHLKPRSVSFFITSLMLVYGLLLDRRLEEAELELEELDRLALNLDLKPGNSTLGLFRYLQSCLAFLQDDPVLAFRHLQGTRELAADKSGWLTGLRLYEVVVLVEMGDVEMAESRLQNLRKHLERHPGPPREQALYRLLYLQGQQFFAFTEVKDEKQLLRSLQKEYHWEPLGHEVVRIDDWYRDRRDDEDVN